MDVVYLPASEPPAACDVVVARDWEATAALWEVQATRRVFRVEVLPHTTLGPWQAERIAAALSLDLPVDFLAVGATVAAQLRELRPEARVVEVRPGLPVVPRDPDAGVVVLEDPHLTVAGVLEAIARGAVPIVQATAPAAEVVAHLGDGIVAEPDDAVGTARFLETLEADPARLAALRDGVAAIAAGWPTQAEADAEEQAALQGLLDEDPPPSDVWGARVMADALAAVAVWRNEHYKLAGELQRYERDEAYRIADRARELWQHDRRLKPVRRVAAPLVRRAKKRAL